MTSLLLAAIVAMPADTPTPLRIAASSLASVEVASQRAAHRHELVRRGRESCRVRRASQSRTASRTRAAGKVEGGLIPLDTVWRFGANMATTLHTDLDITLAI